MFSLREGHLDIAFWVFSAPRLILSVEDTEFQLEERHVKMDDAGDEGGYVRGGFALVFALPSWI